MAMATIKTDTGNRIIARMFLQFFCYDIVRCFYHFGIECRFQPEKPVSDCINGLWCLVFLVF